MLIKINRWRGERCSLGKAKRRIEIPEVLSMLCRCLLENTSKLIFVFYFSYYFVIINRNIFLVGLFFFSFIYLFIYFWPSWVFVAVRGLLIAVASRCGAQALGARASVVVACRL